jgi:hypothetical protein
MRTLVGLAPALCFFVIGCTSTPAAMSVSDHDVAARSEQAQASAHLAAFDPAARTKRACQDPPQTADVGAPCWTTGRRNPTAHNLGEARDHQKLAAAHRAASKSLRDAEEKACAAVADDDRDESPFAHGDDVMSVNKVEGPAPGGAVVVLRLVPGLTAGYLQRLVDCHIARNAAMGEEMPEMEFCPLSIKGVHATVVKANAGIGVEITGSTAAMTAEIQKRATALVATK